MGYEVIFKYSEMQEGGYSEEVKELKKKMGTSADEIDPKSLANLIFGQLARRDVFVRDVEIFEYVKKKIKFKQSPSGVQVGDLRFSYGDCSGTACVADDPVTVRIAPAAPTAIPATPNRALTAKAITPQELQAAEQQGISAADFAYFRNRKPVREEVYSPPPVLASLAAQKGFAMTRDKRYGIYDELALGDISSGMTYVIRDDNGKRASLPDKLFEATPGILTGGFQFNETPPSSGQSGGLAFESEYEESEMPDIRKMG